MKKNLILTIFVILFTYGIVFSASSEEKQIAVVCAGCHGTNGASVGDSIPIIGGQKAGYLKKVMLEYKIGERSGSVMLKISKGYTDERINFLAEYFSKQKWVNTNKNFDNKLAVKGEKMANVCYDCHGKYGEGMDDEYPRISGQPAYYLEKVLLEYKSGVLKSDEMSFINEYSDEDIKALANYFSSIRK